MIFARFHALGWCCVSTGSPGVQWSPCLPACPQVISQWCFRLPRIPAAPSIRPRVSPTPCWLSAQSPSTWVLKEPQICEWDLFVRPWFSALLTILGSTWLSISLPCLGEWGKNPSALEFPTSRLTHFILPVSPRGGWSTSEIICVHPQASFLPFLCFYSSRSLGTKPSGFSFNPFIPWSPALSSLMAKC